MTNKKGGVDMMTVSDKLVEFRQESLKIYRELEKEKKNYTTIVVHLGKCGSAVGAQEVYARFKKLANDVNIENNVKVEVAGCLGLCSMEPLIQVKKPGKMAVKYCLIDETKAEVIFQQHVLNDIIIHPWLLSTKMKGR